MPITYPISLPASPEPAQMEWGALTVAGRNISPYTLSGEAFEWPGNRWRVSVRYPPMNRTQGDALVAALVSLYGAGTMLLGPAGAGKTAKGLASGSPTVLGANQVGKALVINSFDVAQLVTNGRFNTDISGWTTNLNGSTGGSITWNSADQSMKLTQGSNSVWLNAYQAITLVKDKIYSIYAVRVASGGGTVRIGLSTNNTELNGPPDVAYFEFVGSSVSETAKTFIAPYTGTFYVRIMEGSPASGFSNIDYVSVAECQLYRGDYLQLGNGATSRLHMVTEDYPGDINGKSIFNVGIWPRLRESPADNSAIVVSSPKGLFRLAVPQQKWSMDAAYTYGVSFDAEEAF